MSIRSYIIGINLPEYALNGYSSNYNRFKAGSNLTYS